MAIIRTSQYNGTAELPPCDYCGGSPVVEEEFLDDGQTSTGFRVRCLACERSTQFWAAIKHAHDEWLGNIAEGWQENFDS